MCWARSRRMTFDDLVPQAQAGVCAGSALRVLSRETIVRLKRLSSDNKDKLRLPVLGDSPPSRGPYSVLTTAVPRRVTRWAVAASTAALSRPSSVILT